MKARLSEKAQEWISDPSKLTVLLRAIDDYRKRERNPRARIKGEGVARKHGKEVCKVRRVYGLNPKLP